ncbi:hypothetical protein [Pontibacter liquoris]|uniref:hypothetical protein n=1 Tax=Pontibacter liquoris TaxID=2905677 RepID=UPI001FA7EB9B|nr:hypothetical protein [Pontibacter liquoris]
MKNILRAALLAFILTTVSACGEQNKNEDQGNGTTEKLNDSTTMPSEADTTVTLDPDTATEHDMTL